jgi:signal transduction histidine kinase
MNSAESELKRKKVAIPKVLPEGRFLLENAITEIRKVSSNLRPTMLDELGLAPAVHALVKNIEKRTKIKISTQIKMPAKKLPAEYELHIFRIIQEGLNNIEKHSSASKAEVNISNKKGTMRIIIEDNGKGFDKNKTDKKTGKKFGLLSMKERSASVGGTLNINSKVKKGTRIEILIPV